MKEDQKTIVAKHFDSYAENWEERLKDHCYLTRYNSVKSMLAGDEKKVADFGCGTGDYSTLFPEKSDYFGLDNSEGMIEKAQTLYSGRRFSVEDVENTSLADGEVDCALSIGLYEYLENPDSLTTELIRVTKPGGRIICSFPNSDNKAKSGISLTALPCYLTRKVIGKLKRKVIKQYSNKLAPEGYVKDKRIFHRNFNEEEVLQLFKQSSATHLRTRYANFSILVYYTGFNWLKGIDEAISTIMTRKCWDKRFYRYASILILSFRKER